jgi:hypothetical protein
MISISDSSHLLPTPTPTSTSTSSIVNIPSTNPYGLCIYRSSQDKLFYAPRDATSPLSWAGVAFNGMDVCKMLEPETSELPVEFTTTSTFKLPKPCKPPTMWEIYELHKELDKKRPVCYTCGRRIHDSIEDVYDEVGDYIGKEMIYSCDCDIMWDYMEPFMHPTRRSAKHPTGRSVKRPALRKRKLFA